MRWASLVLTAPFVCFLSIGVARSAELKVISSDGFALVLDAIKPQYERTTGNTLVIHYDVADNLLKDILGGAPFDVVISTDEVMKAVIGDGVAVGQTHHIARSGIGLAYKAGTPRPDIHDGASFRATLSAAPSIAYIPAGASGAQFEAIARKLGILDQVKAKAAKTAANEVRGASSAGGSADQNSVLRAVLDGSARFGVQAVSNILPVAGLEYVPFPPDMQLYRSYSGAVGTDSTQPRAAAALLKLLAEPRFAPLIRSNGMEPG